MTSGPTIHPLVYDVIPTVIESGPRSERAFDIFSLLLKERIVFLGTPIDDQIANLIVAQLLYLQREDPERDISMYIHSPGGVITAGNTNFGAAYCIAGEIVARKCHVPHLYQFELMGTPDDVEAVREGLTSQWLPLCSPTPA